MKGGQQGVVLKLFLLIIVPQLSSSNVVHQADVEEYVIGRRGGSKSDLFFLNYKNGSYCIEDPNQVSKWCTTLKASYDGTVTNRKSCGCKCQFGHPTFLSQTLTCINENQAERLGGCSSGYIHFKKDWQSEKLLSEAVDLLVANSKELAPSQSRGTCSVINGQYFDYSGFQIEWKSIHHQIFSFCNSDNKLKLQWTPDKNRNLSGRIIRLNVTCHVNTSSITQSPMERCMLFKASGNVTYYAPSKTMSVLAVTTALSSHTPSSFYSSLPSLQLPQSAQIFSLPPKPQPTLSPLPSPSLSATTSSPTAHTPSSFYSSSPSLRLPQSAQKFSLPPKLQPTLSPLPSPSLSATTRSLTMHTDRFSTFLSTHIQTSSLQTRPALRSSRPILPPTSKAEMESYLPVNSKEISEPGINTGIPKSSVSTGEPNYSEASELPPTELSLPTRDGPGDKEARKSGKDKGVAIGAGVGGAVAFGIIVIGVIIIFCRRKKSRENTEMKAKLDVGVKNPVYGKPQDDIEIERPREKAKTLSEQESQPTYMELVDKKGFPA
ncbi:uncharacterized protein LOC111318990 [Stylophora pistillata]|uniref:uncharacterized protein LOC111318990 n=1 Tax=Stylophora pistillata TaxID=50429 RepID=UPI000C047605|nr:uncharacterized protein LOC111318990 [Stylophora pistillata]